MQRGQNSCDLDIFSAVDNGCNQDSLRSQDSPRMLVCTETRPDWKRDCCPKLLGSVHVQCWRELAA